MIFQVGVPSDTAASTYGSSRIDSTSERTRRVTRGISGIAMATITESRLASPQRHQRDGDQDARGSP